MVLPFRDFYFYMSVDRDYSGFKILSEMTILEFNQSSDPEASKSQEADDYLVPDVAQI
jgi:hypothetical protein